jgi:hypothetical protein
VVACARSAGTAIMLRRELLHPLHRPRAQHYVCSEFVNEPIRAPSHHNFNSVTSHGTSVRQRHTPHLLNGAVWVCGRVQEGHRVWRGTRVNLRTRSRRKTSRGNQPQPSSVQAGREGCRGTPRFSSESADSATRRRSESAGVVVHGVNVHGSVCGRVVHLCSCRCDQRRGRGCVREMRPRE